jgi:uncharacterized protein YjaG (DUF416 family)
MTPKGPTDMSKAEFGEPWTYCGAEGVWPTARVTNAEDKVILFDAHSRDLERAATCVNACATVTHPDKLPALLEACKAMDATVSASVAGNASDLAVAEASLAVIKAFRAVQPQQAERELPDITVQTICVCGCELFRRIAPYEIECSKCGKRGNIDTFEAKYKKDPAERTRER